MKKIVAILTMVSCLANAWGQCVSFDDTGYYLNPILDRVERSKLYELSDSVANIKFEAYQFGDEGQISVYEFVDGAWVKEPVFRGLVDESIFKGTIFEVTGINKHATAVAFTTDGADAFIKNVAITYKATAKFESPQFKIEELFGMPSIELGTEHNANVVGQPITFQATLVAHNINEPFVVSNNNIAVHPTQISHCGEEDVAEPIFVTFNPFQLGYMTETIQIAGQTLVLKAYGKLAPPINLTTISVTSNAIHVAWEPNDEFTTGYQVELLDANKNVMEVANVTTPYYKRSQLNFNSIYYVRVRSTVGNDLLKWSDYTDYLPIKTFDLKKPQARIERLTTHEVSVAWDAVDYVKKYDFCIEDETGHSVYRVLTDNCAITYSKLTPNTNYRIFVRSVTANGLSDFTEIPIITLLETPQNLQSTAVTEHSFMLHWDAVPDADGYVVNCNGNTIMLDKDNTSYKYVGSPEHTTYACYVIAASTKGNHSEPTETVSVTTLYTGVAIIDDGTTGSFATLAQAINAFSADDNEVVLLQDVAEDIVVRDYVNLRADGHAIGNITVDIDGHLQLTSDAVCNDILLKGSNNSLFASGRISKSAEDLEITIKGDVMFDKEISSLVAANTWYPISVPFEMRVSDDIYNSEGEKLTYNQQYSFYKYDTKKRATDGGNRQESITDSWLSMSADEVLHPGIGYMITVSHAPYGWLRFKASNKQDVFETSVEVSLNFYPSSNWNNTKNEGWNYLANPYSAQVAIPTIPEGLTYVQVATEGTANKDNIQYRVMPVDTVFNPGSLMVVQVDQSETLVFTTNLDVKWPKDEENVEAIEFRFAQCGDANYDAMFVHASKEAPGVYKIGKNVAKFGHFTNYNSLWIDAYNTPLAAYQAKMKFGVAYCTMMVNATSETDYQLSIHKHPENITVWLLKNGIRIHNLSKSPYQFHSTKGMKAYGICVETSDTTSYIPTDIDNQEAFGATAYISENVLYIENVNQGEHVMVYDGSMMFYNTISKGETIQYVLPYKGIFIVQIGEKVVKLLNN